MPSQFVIRVERADGESVELIPGGHGERDFIAACTAAIVAKGVGVFRTEAQVKAAILGGIHDAFLAVKAEVVPK